MQEHALCEDADYLAAAVIVGNAMLDDLVLQEADMDVTWVRAAGAPWHEYKRYENTRLTRAILNAARSGK